MQRIKFLKWEEFQHYKDRNPPWIKLHFSIINSRPWVKLDDAGKLLAITCMLLASRNDGEMECDSDYVKRVAYLSKTPDFDALVRCGLCVYTYSQADASTCKQMLQNATESVSVSASVSVSPLSLPLLNTTTAEKIYEHYPRKEAKQNALRAIFAALKKHDAQFLEERVKAYAAAVAMWPEADKKFIPHPASWFNAGRYEDDPATWERKEQRAKPKFDRDYKDAWDQEITMKVT